VDLVTGIEGTWPTATLGTVSHLRVLAAGLPGAHLHEDVIDAPFDDVWSFVSDLERSAPLFDSDVHSLQVLDVDGEHWRIRARLPRWAATAPLHFDVTMRPGWCWMVSRPQAYVIGMAAERAGSATRFGHMEGVVLPAPRWLGPAVRPLLTASRWRHRFHVPGDVARIVDHLRGHASGER
jgi:hypothetical protein